MRRSQHPGGDLSVTLTGIGRYVTGLRPPDNGGQSPTIPVTTGQRVARLTAETTAFSEARVVFASIPIPHRILSSIAHSM
ncbi:hypothetical protein GCM10010313_58560 [Streptomyces violarus]|nr:hypothetical protein GCM10010313_58560 [Streptomyces violarus]